MICFNQLANEMKKMILDHVNPNTARELLKTTKLLRRHYLFYGLFPKEIHRFELWQPINDESFDVSSYCVQISTNGETTRFEGRKGQMEEITCIWEMKSPATSFKCKRDVLWKVVLEKIRFLADISIELIPKNGKVPDFWIEFLSRFRQVRNFHLHMHGTLKDGNAALLEHWFPVVLNGFVLRTVDDYSTKEALFQRVQLQNTKHFVLKQEKWKELSATRADSYTFNRYVRDSLHDFWTIGQPGTNPRAKVMLYDDPCFYFATKQDCLASIERLLRDNVVKVLINLDDAIVWMPNSTGEPVSIREFTLQPQNLAINPLVSEKFARFAQVEEEISRFHFRNSNEMLERSSVTVYFRHYDHKGRVLLIIARICFKQDIDFDAFQARHYPFQLQVVLDFL